MTTPRQALLALLLIILLLPDPGYAQVLAPPPPTNYRVVLRYLLDAPPPSRIPSFRRLEKALADLGFDKDPGPDDEPENRTYTRMSGRIPSRAVPRLSNLPAVRGFLLYPDGFTPPADRATPVKVVLELRGQMPIDLQRRRVEQLLAILHNTGFREAVGYDHREGTRVVGSIPAGNVEQLLQDLRATQGNVADLLARNWPIQFVEVKPEAVARPFVPAALVPREKAYLAKISPELRERLAKDARQREQVEVILASTPHEEDPRYERFLPEAVPGLQIEDRLGAIVVARVNLGDLERLAQMDEVSGIRLPRAAIGPVPAGADESDDHVEALKRWGVDRLHAARAKGQGVRAAVIAFDFRGWRQFLGKGLPENTRLVDLTPERSEDIQPEAEPAQPAGTGVGVLQALALTVAAPAVDLTLIRISATSPSMLARVARYLGGEGVPSPALLARQEELFVAEKGLVLESEALLTDRQRLFGIGATDADIEMQRMEYLKRQKEFDQRAELINQRRRRYLDLQKGLLSLKGIRIVVCGLTWADGYPVDGGSSLVQRLNQLCPSSILWLQSAGDLQGQAWSGLARDLDGNRLMDFSAAGAMTRAERWSREVNFLAWQTDAGKRSLELPAKATIRLSLQWREYADRRLRYVGEEAVRPSRANLGLIVVRQRDPEGRTMPSDDFEVKAYTGSSQPPVRLDARIDSALYEQVLEFTPEAAGRYAVLIECPGASVLRLQDEPTIPAAQRFWELRPRLLVQATDAASRNSGRPIWLDYDSREGVLGLPADAHGVVSVSASDSAGKPRPSSPIGPPFGLRLLRKPEVYAPDAVNLPGGPVAIRGSQLAAGFAAGVAASALSAGHSTAALHASWRATPADGWKPQARRAP